ncbi:MAG TPA: hypothetical protein VFD41_00980 [Actinomycetales bacterium]|nr:hypothetical protein [Actinomycetales bacterium]
MATEQGSDGGAGAPRSLLRSVVADALAQAPGPGLLAALTELTARGDLSARELTETAAGWKRMTSHCQAGTLTVAADLVTAMTPTPEAPSRPGRTDPTRAAADELAPALGIAPRAASSLTALAVRCGDLPDGLDALIDGRMDYTQLRILDRVVRDLPGPAAAQVEAAAVAWAARRTAQQLHADLAAEAMRVDPAHAADAAARGVAERDVTFRPSPLPGCRRLVADTPLVTGTAAWLAINAAAKNAKKLGVRLDGTPEDRTLAQLRADIHTALLTGQGDPLNGCVPTPDELARLAEVQVVVAADTLTGASDLPAQVPGVGPVDGETVRHLASRTRWRRLVADPATGTLVLADPRIHPADGMTGIERRLQDLLADPLTPSHSDDGSRYRPSPRLRRHVHIRDATCLGPACHHPAAGTQLDHTINHGHHDDHGAEGTTTAGDLGSLCDRVHNALIHQPRAHGGWLLRQLSPGEFEWTSPTGRSYTRHARPLVPGWKAQEHGEPRERPPPG